MTSISVKVGSRVAGSALVGIGRVAIHTIGVGTGCTISQVGIGTGGGNQCETRNADCT